MVLFFFVGLLLVVYPTLSDFYNQKRQSKVIVDYEELLDKYSIKDYTELFDKAEKSTKNTFFYRGAIFPTKYIKEHASLTKEDYIKLLKMYKAKILAITGKADVQADYRKLEALQDQDNAVIYIPDELNHFLRDVDTDPSILNIKKEYKLCLKREISPKLRQTINQWSK